MASIPLTEFGPMVLSARLGKRWSQEALAAEALGNADRKGYISQIENGRLPGISAMTAQRLAMALGLDASVVPRLAGVIAPDAREIGSEIADLRNAVGGLAAALADSRHLSRDTLIALATRFGQAEAHKVPDGTLRAFLSDKAQEYQSYRQTIAALDDRVAAIANLKGAAQDAAERLDFDEVETLLARVHEVELDIAAATANARAENALLRGRPEQAHSLLSAAADSFAAIDQLEAARRRWRYGELLHHYGLRYGGYGLTLARALFDRLLQDLPQSVDPRLWAATHNSRATALSVQGSRTAGSDGTALLAKAVEDCMQALTVFTRADHPADWATTLQNRARALQAQGSRTAGSEGAVLLAHAVEDYTQALDVLTRAEHTVDWATTLQNRAISLEAQSSRSVGSDWALLMSLAIADYTQALTVRTRADHPVEWAATLQNRAGALSEQGRRTSEPEAATLLARAVEDYTQALTVFIRADHPVHWALTLQNRALAVQAQGSRTAGSEGASLLSRAVEDYKQALTVRTRVDHPVHWATTQVNMSLLEVARAGHDTCTDPVPHLRAALDHVQAALTIYDPIHMPHDHGTATERRTEILAALAAHS